MGVQISEIIPRKEISIKDLKGKTIAIDAYNTLYQFLTTIRQVDGTLLMDKQGNITSHLSGIFYRNLNLLQDGLKIIYVFDGKPDELKLKEIEKRQDAKKIAKENYEKAKSEEDIPGMRKYSQQFVKITSEILEQSKELLNAMGIPCIESLGEGEAEAAFLVNQNKAWASASQDYDSLLFGAQKLIRNLTLARKRKTISGYVDINPELITLEDVLNKLQIDRDQLICLGILVGTDFNPGGIKGIGQKRALEIVQKNKYPVKIFQFIEQSDKYQLDFNWQDVFKQFRDYQSKPADIKFKEFNEKAVKDILIKHDFSEERIDSALNRLKEAQEKNKQKTLF